MAGKKQQREFKEKISPFLREKMEKIKIEKGENSEDYQALYLQYSISDKEKEQSSEANVRHWEADLDIESQPQGVERLYSKSVVIEPTMVCVAHCRYCLRANYNIFTLKEDELTNIAKFCGSNNLKNQINEVLITGGDPLIVPKRLNYLVETLIEYAPNITIMRIATRLPSHDPYRIDNNVYEIFRKHNERVNFELATQINHHVELFPETVEVFQKFRKMGIPIYSQNILLKGVNDKIETLISLYNNLRKIGIEPHYLFHCVPMRGMHHFRTTVEKGLRLARELTNSGKISGRVKPMYALMTDIGKITLYEGTILDKNKKTNEILVQSSYKYEERLKNNPNWKLPKTAEVDENGYLRMWYLDGSDD